MAYSYRIYEPDTIYLQYDHPTDVWFMKDSTNLSEYIGDYFS